MVRAPLAHSICITFTYSDHEPKYSIRLINVTVNALFLQDEAAGAVAVRRPRPAELDEAFGGRQVSDDDSL